MLDITKASFRYTILFFACMLTFGSYFVFDLPSAISDELIIYLDITKDQYQLFYTAYTICNFISVCFGGYLLDKTGARVGAVVFTAFICTGQLIWGIGGQYKSYIVMIIGRAVYGIGGGCICVCQESICTHYFKGKELALAFGATLCVSRLGSVLNFFISPLICEEIGVPNTIWVSVSICFISILFVIIFCYLDKVNTDQTHSQMKAKTKKINIKDLLTFRAEFWLLVSICAVFYGCIFPFISVARSMFKTIWKLDSWTSSVCTGVVYDVALIFSIPMGKLVDHVGKRLTFLICATIMTVISNLLLLLCQPTTSNKMSAIPWISMVILGFAYCFTASTLWSGVSLVVKKAQVGSAMAITTAIQMLMNSIINIIVGALTLDQNIYVFVSLAVLSALIVIALGFVDFKNYKILNNKNSVGIFKDDIVKDEEQGLLQQETNDSPK
ncbi:Major_facilitator superfamily protein [Hexamita inflata]|uniref:Lysosomal dipeptide transporter MFSD1 n=1 Tax=Hexamita inflata TaxID=28002 RepID=A0AA86QFR2_9EUKA|nr:Major facilitator superfamily protein [Hexamita inflata]CAI9955911.1 Major facilitator superfamily protein [Hexamita inflata]